jgi:RES domain-containing protein
MGKTRICKPPERRERIQALAGILDTGEILAKPKNQVAAQRRRKAKPQPKSTADFRSVTEPHPKAKYHHGDVIAIVPRCVRLTRIVKLAPNPRYEVFVEELRKSRRYFSPWEAIVFRAAPLEFARIVKLLDGMGSFRFGGRWSAAETFPAVNLSTSREGALNESNANFAYYNLSQIEVRPKVIVGIRLRLKRIIDLKDPHGISREDWLHLEELLAEDWRKVNDAGHESESQAFGRAAHDAEAEGISMASARVSQASNIIYFPDSLSKNSRVQVLGEDELERWLKKR